MWSKLGRTVKPQYLWAFEAYIQKQYAIDDDKLSMKIGYVGV